MNPTAVTQLPVATTPWLANPALARPLATPSVILPAASKPALTQPAAVEPKSHGLLVLGLVKTLLGGLLVGGIASVKTHSKFLPAIGIDMLLGIGETFFTKWVMQSGNPVTEKMLELSAKVSKAPDDKPVIEMSDHEKEKAMVPISAVASVISALLTLTILDKLHDHPKLAPYLKSKPITQSDVNQATGLMQRIKNGQFKLQEGLHKLKPPSWLTSHPVYKVIGNKYLNIIVAAIGLGLFEGVLAEKLSTKDAERQLNKMG